MDNTSEPMVKPTYRDRLPPREAQALHSRQAPGEDPAGLIQRAFADPSVPASVWRQLADNAYRVQCPEGPVRLTSPRRPSPSWWLIAKGSVAQGHLQDDGSFEEMRRLRSGDWLDIAGALSPPWSWIHQAVCCEATELLGLSLDMMLDAAAQDRLFAQAFAQVMAANIRDLSERLDDVAQADVPVRLARWILRQIELGDPHEHVLIEMRDRKYALARQLCTTPSTLSRTLNAFSKVGVADTKGSGIIVHDVAALRRIAWPAEQKNPRVHWREPLQHRRRADGLGADAQDS